MKTNKKGISLIVLIITLIVMVIIAGAIILYLDDSKIINQAERAVDMNNIAVAKEVVNVARAEWRANQSKLEDEGYSFVSYAEEKLTDAGFVIGFNGGEVEINDRGVLYAYVKPTVPVGFVESEAETEDEVKEGFVIYEGTDPVDDSNVEEARKTRNQYVWVPVPNMEEFERYDWGKGLSIDKTTSYDLDNAEEAVEYEAMKKSVEKYGGFYIARYEAGKEEGELVSKKEATVWSYINWTNAKTACETATTDYVVGHLIYGEEWDAALKFISKTDKTYALNSTGKGWYDDNYKSGNPEHLTGKDVGTTAANKLCNIYDMAGNVYEWTMERYSATGGRVRRGMCFIYNAFNGSGLPASRRDYLPVTSLDSAHGFRPALYIK